MRSAPTAPAEPEEVTSAGSISAVISSLGSPETRISMRSTMLMSWRTLPGHGWTCRVAMASSPSLRFGRPVAVLIRSMKYSTSSEMSSRRSERPGTLSGTTFSR